ncbi:MAG TPA: aminotransferase class V-fold PLP-dependent enzyme [Ktedonobacteraceae bacterium]|nr:aminotransferase class V-fold PLP-dependent enzyme [Ktedonobacteraceae bacterium]
MLGSQRALFEIPEEIAYLNCSYMSPLLRSVREAGQQAVERKSQPWNIYTKDFFEDAEIARQLFAQLIEADADGVALIPSASYGIGVAVANLPLKQGQSIVVLAEQFPANVYPWREMAARCGATIETVERPENGDWTPVVLATINEQTGIVALPNCHWTDGSLIDLRQVSKRAHEVGAALVLDVTQSLGAYPFNLSEIRPDFLVAATYKWLLGPYSMGFLYVAPKYREGIPLEYTWIGREGSEDFSQLVNYRSGYQPGARRFDVGERSNFILLPMVIAALRQILTWQVPEINITLKALTAEIEREAVALGFLTVPAELRSGNIIGLRRAAGLPANLTSELMKRNVFVSVRGSSIRVSPHLYNTKEDIGRFFEALSLLISN